MPPTPSPYRSLPAARRIELVTHALRTEREARTLYTQRLVARGGFRAVTIKSWPPDKLAREVVRMNAEQPQDELDLLRMLYVDVDPSLQITFLDAAGVGHEAGKIPEELEVPYADAESVRRGAIVVKERHGADGMLYLRTLAKYSLPAWPGIDAMVEELEG